MIDILIMNASEVVSCGSGGKGPKTGNELKYLNVIRNNGYIAIKNGKIVALGNMPAGLEAMEPVRTIIDASGKVVMPGFVDCHTHLVFSGSREEEFYEKIRGVSYLEILRQGGGILDTVRKTQKSSFNFLFREAKKRAIAFLQYGTTTVEIKSGYGLSPADELRILRVIQKLKENLPVNIVPTFLGAHAFPPNISRESYLKEVLSMIVDVARQKLAEFCDVFCEKEAFSLEETRQVLEKAKSSGLKLKLHAGQFNDLGGVELGVELGAVSIDHLDCISDKNIGRLAESKTIAVLLPGVSFHLASDYYARARKMIEQGVAVALATDFNPGSSPTYSMQMIIALACRFMKMTPEEAINAATINAAYAIDRGRTLGSLEIGKQADIIILDIPNYKCLPYYFGVNLVETVIKKGKIVYPVRN